MFIYKTVQFALNVRKTKKGKRHYRY